MRIKRILLGAVAVGAAVLIGVAVWAYILLFVATPAEPYEYTVTVPQGVPFAHVTRQLAEDGVVPNEIFFRAYARVLRLDGNVQAGVYRVDHTMTAVDLLDDLVGGRTLDTSVRVTIPEGWTIERIAGRLATSGIVDAEEFLERVFMSPEYRDFPLLAGVDEGVLLEGFLFPETYHLEPGSSATAIVRAMLTQFHRSLERDVPAELLSDWSDPDVSGNGLRELLTLASIVEAESPTEDMPLVAGVFVNRVRSGWRLESDATVNYALGTSKLQPTYADVLTEHPYNTYRFAGLPPGPINNPGMSAILASIEPVEHEYFFFLHKPTRETVLSRTYSDHLAAKARYLD